MSEFPSFEEYVPVSTPETGEPYIGQPVSGYDLDRSSEAEGLELLEEEQR